MEDVLDTTRIAIIGAGAIGTCIANGLADSGRFRAEDIRLTRRNLRLLDEMKRKGFIIERDNRDAVRNSEVVILAVEPHQIDDLLGEIGPELADDTHTLISVVTGVSMQHIIKLIGKQVALVRAMPNTAIAVRESMTCLASATADGGAIAVARSVFDTVGKTLVIDEEGMNAATALVACGIAFFFRAIRAASQGGIEIGFHSEEALEMAAQTARGAASLLLATDHHPEQEIDRVTTPRGCTIAGLNQMEHEGFSSAMIKGITASAEKASTLYVAHTP
jgi:pyrroline-5-carboxylate reductase